MVQFRNGYVFWIPGTKCGLTNIHLEKKLIHPNFGNLYQASHWRGKKSPNWDVGKMTKNKLYPNLGGPNFFQIKVG
jgi:hypothetical protein